MAGIEKVCEFGSEDYLAGDMYKHKHNLIQINPEARSNFKNQKCTLIIAKPLLVSAWKYRGEVMSYSDIKYHESFPNNILIKHWEYILKFEQPELQGNVYGEYYNQTFDLSTTIRKIKNLVGGNKYLTIIRS